MYTCLASQTRSGQAHASLRNQSFLSMVYVPPPYTTTEARIRKAAKGKSRSKGGLNKNEVAVILTMVLGWDDRLTRYASRGKRHVSWDKVWWSRHKVWQTGLVLRQLLSQNLRAAIRQATPFKAK